MNICIVPWPTPFLEIRAVSGEVKGYSCCTKNKRLLTALKGQNFASACCYSSWLEDLGSACHQTFKPEVKVQEWC